MRLQIWLEDVFALAERVPDLAASTLAAKRQALDRRLPDILTAPNRCDRDQLMAFLDHSGSVKVADNGCERLLCPAVVQRRVTNGYHVMSAATVEADIRTVVDTARLTGAAPFPTLLATVRA